MWRVNKANLSKKRCQAHRTINMSVSARNLRKSELGAVIFGCKNHTMTECLKEMIFGLPDGHFSYVKNVTAGLTLFLFNYSDRTLHGIFEAICQGQRNINPFAWTTNNDPQDTPYAAQVRVKVRSQCRPLVEEQFKPIIARNYYEDRLFWFELDKVQADKLTKLFLLSPLPQRNLVPPVAEFRNDMILNELHENVNGPQALLNLPSNAPEKKWSELFKTSSSSSAVTNVQGFEMQNENASSSMALQCHMDGKIVSSGWETSEPLPESCPDPLDSSVPDTWEKLADMDTEVRDIHANEVLSEQDLERENGYPDLADVHSSEDETFSECMIAKAAGEAVLENEILTIRPTTHNSINVFEGLHMDMQCSSFEFLAMKLVQEIEGLKVTQLNQRKKLVYLEHELVLSKMEIEKLKKRCSESGTSGLHCNEEGSESPNFKTGRSVLIVGGFDGSSWIQDLNIYSPSEDNFKSLRPMTSLRSYASVAKLNDELYIFGGANDGVWYDTVESYNPISNQWVERPSLNRKKGSVAGVSAYDTIFAIGGGNGVETFSEVELFDLNIGRWLSTQSMLEKRFTPAATDLDGALYVTGGYDGKNYLSSVERFDPRESTWTSLQSMKTARGGHSLVASNGKLYALGGYNGTTMVSTVEVFEPRNYSWIMIEPMSVSRGYFGSFVLDGKIYVLGGLNEKNEVLDVVEFYEEGSGWEVAQSSAIGKRGFFSALVL